MRYFTFAYECPICGALYPHPSYKCSGIGGFADHETVPVKQPSDKWVRESELAELDRLREALERMRAWAKSSRHWTVGKHEVIERCDAALAPTDSEGK